MQDELAQHGISIMLSYLDLFLKYQVPGIIPWSLLAAQCFHESGFDPMAVSPAGALGMAQFMPHTWASWGEGSPFDAEASVKAQRDYMLSIAIQFAETRRCHSWWWVVAYTWGPQRTLAVGNIEDVPQTVARHATKVLVTGRYYHNRFELYAAKPKH